jgi:hypothetical protein
MNAIFATAERIVSVRKSVSRLRANEVVFDLRRFDASDFTWGSEIGRPLAKRVAVILVARVGSVASSAKCPQRAFQQNCQLVTAKAGYALGAVTVSGSAAEVTIYSFSNRLNQSGGLQIAANVLTLQKSRGRWEVTDYFSHTVLPPGDS